MDLEWNNVGIPQETILEQFKWDLKLKGKWNTKM